MHYYKRNIGDYYKKAGRLSILEHGTYTLLIDACYDRERFPTKEQAIEWCWAKSAEELAAIDTVLARFFDHDEKTGEYRQKRIAEELAIYAQKAEKNKQIAIDRENRKKQKGTNANDTCTNEHEPCKNVHLTINHKPLTINQEPDKDIVISGTTLVPANAVATTKPKALRLSAEWQLPNTWGQWAIEQGLSRDSVVLEAAKFRDYWIAKSGKDAAKLDWQATWRNWIRNAGKSNDAKSFISDHTDKSWAAGL